MQDNHEKVLVLDSGTHDSDDAAQVFAKVTDALSFFLAQE